MAYYKVIFTDNEPNPTTHLYKRMSDELLYKSKREKLNGKDVNTILIEAGSEEETLEKFNKMKEDKEL